MPEFSKENSPILNRLFGLPTAEQSAEIPIKWSEEETVEGGASYHHSKVRINTRLMDDLPFCQELWQKTEKALQITEFFAKQ
jgi:hypothetical protein